MDKNKPQAQDSTQDQLERLYYIAINEGLYDAADAIRERFDLFAAS